MFAYKSVYIISEIKFLSLDMVDITLYNNVYHDGNIPLVTFGRSIKLIKLAIC